MCWAAAVPLLSALRDSALFAVLAQVQHRLRLATCINQLLLLLLQARAKAA